MAADPTTMHPASGSGNGQEKEQEALKDTFPASDPVAISFDAPRPGP